MAWRTLSLKNLLPDRVRGTFPACFFSGSLFFFLRWVLMLWPYAGGCREDNRPQCADRPRLPPLSPPFPSNSLPYRATNWPLWESSTAPTTRAGLNPPPKSIPAWDTFCSHPPHTAPLCALDLPPKNLFPSVSGWGWVCRAGLPHQLYLLLISFSQRWRLRYFT